MLDAIQKFFDNNLFNAEKSRDEQGDQHSLRVATAALLIEMMLQDEEEHQSEKQAIMGALQNKFDLSSDETKELYRLARKERAEATDYHQFTHLITERFSQPQKIRIIELLWSVAFADGDLDKYEEHMVRRISDLIHVSHKDFLQAKHKYESGGN